MGKRKHGRKAIADAIVAQALADATAPVPASLLRPPGVTITKPEDLTDGQLPYEKADRTPAGPLQMLEEFATQQLGLETAGRLISMWGQICERGSVVAFRITTAPGKDETAGYVIASYEPDAADDIWVGSLAVARLQVHERGGKFRVAARASELGALAAYQRRIGELS